MKKILILFCVIVSNYANYTLSQPHKRFGKPDFSLIKEAISNKESKEYYPVLLNRYINNDSTLTDEQYRLLYFGYVFSDSYDPYWLSSYSEVLKKYYKKSDTNCNDCDSIINYCKLSIADFPFDLQKIGMLVFAYRKKGDLVNERLWGDKYIRLWNIIRTTGSGIDNNNPICVITLNHEYELYSNTSNFQPISQTQTSDSCDYMEFIIENRLSRLYFDSKIMMKMSNKSKITKQKAIETLNVNYNQLSSAQIDEILSGATNLEFNLFEGNNYRELIFIPIIDGHLKRLVYNINNPWIRSDMILKKDTSYYISIFGFGSTSRRKVYLWFGPEGATSNYKVDHFPNDSLAPFSVIGKLGKNGKIFSLGKSIELKPNEDNELFVGYNDDLFDDNIGFFVIDIFKGKKKDVLKSLKQSKRKIGEFYGDTKEK